MLIYYLESFKGYLAVSVKGYLMLLKKKLYKIQCTCLAARISLATRIARGVECNLQQATLSIHHRSRWLYAAATVAAVVVATVVVAAVVASVVAAAVVAAAVVVVAVVVADVVTAVVASVLAADVVAAAVAVVARAHDEEQISPYQD